MSTINHIDSYYSVTICSYVISWYKVVEKKCRIVGLIFAVIKIIIILFTSIIAKISIVLVTFDDNQEI